MSGNALVSTVSASVGIRAAVLVCGPVVTQFPLVPELVWHPVDLAQPDRAAARGQTSTQSAADIAKLCPRAAVW